VGYSCPQSFGNGDWTGIAGNGGDDAIIVKYDNNGNVVWKKNFGGAGNDHYRSVTTVSDGIVAVGYSETSLYIGGLTGVIGKGLDDAIIVKYDNNGNVVWKKSFGGSGYDCYNSVTAVSDGIVAVGYSDTFTRIGDWAGVTGKGSDDAIVVKYDNNGNVKWNKNFGGSGIDRYNSVTAVPDGIVAVGYSYTSSFGNGDWAGIAGNGGDDAIIVKYDNNGNVKWKKNLGGSGYGRYNSVTAVPDGIIVAGYSGNFGISQWYSTGNDNDSDDAIVVKYDNTGNKSWEKNLGVPGSDRCHSVTATPGGIVAGGYSAIEMYTTISVTDLTGVQLTAAAKKPLTLTGTVVPSDATYKTISWSLKSAGTTGATINGNVLSTTGTGTVVVTATIAEAGMFNKDFTRDFSIIVGDTISTVNITATADSMSTVSSSGAVAVPKGINQTFMFSAKTAICCLQ
jgi:uncharacterized protein YuzE